MSRTPREHQQFIAHRFATRKPMPEPRLMVPDDVLVDTMVELGFDRDEAFTQWQHTMPRQYAWLRGLALQVYLDVRAAARGDVAAKERVDYMREAWQAQSQNRARRKREQGT